MLTSNLCNRKNIRIAIFWASKVASRYYYSTVNFAQIDGQETGSFRRYTWRSLCPIVLVYNRENGHFDSTNSLLLGFNIQKLKKKTKKTLVLSFFFKLYFTYLVDFFCWWNPVIQSNAQISVGKVWITKRNAGQNLQNRNIS